MFFRGPRLFFVFLLTSVAMTALQTRAQSSSSASSKHVRKPAPETDSQLDAGSVSDGVYRNQSLGFSCKIPAGWVLRTEEMNAREGNEPASAEKGNDAKAAGAAATAESSRAALDRTAGGGCPHTGCGRVLLAAFSRPPEARGEDVNASILIAAESAAAYPGMKEAAQYFGPLTEVAKAQGFEVVEEPYEFVVGTKTLVRGDFQKDVGTRVMRQATLAMLTHGYAVSFTVIGGTEDEVEELIEGLSFGAGGKTGR